MNDGRAKAWAKLAALPHPGLAGLLSEEKRLVQLATRIDLPDGGILFDWSKTHLYSERIAAFEELAEACQFKQARALLFEGGVVNPSEGRAAGHLTQRGFGSPACVEEAQALHLRMRMMADAIQQGAFGEIRHLIHIGIGGSALGPALVTDALGRDLAPAEGLGIDVHVVSNVDGCALEQAFAACDPATTLIAIASKAFTTIETMTNADSAMRWLAENGVADPAGRVIALTASPEKAVEWGVDETRILPFPDAVGGRYSLWSSIGFPMALALGWEEFVAMLDGAGVMDQHFLSANGADNLPLRAAFADQLYLRRGCESRAVFAYDERLRLLPAYLKQLEMESNGKGVMADGSPLDGPSAPVVWGGVGTDAQHAVFQLLHQGTVEVPVEFIASITPGHDLDMAHHRILLMNCFAQGAALMAGREHDDPARSFPGNRPSATILCDDLDATTLGALIAFYEHRVFANAVLMGINPFDQFGVELGKDVARSIEQGDVDFDISTLGLLKAAGFETGNHHG